VQAHCLFVPEPLMQSLTLHASGGGNDAAKEIRVVSSSGSRWRARNQGPGGYDGKIPSAWKQLNYFTKSTNGIEDVDRSVFFMESKRTPHKSSAKNK
jgi:hypothetical protein